VSKELTMTGRRVGGAEAVQLGLANRVVPPGCARGEAVAWAHELAGMEQRGLRLAKEVHNRPVLAALRERAASWDRANSPAHEDGLPTLGLTSGVGPRTSGVGPRTSGVGPRTSGLV
jgi:enoyl-CoA hydratase